MPGPSRAIPVLLALVISVFAVLLLAGHGPWAGRTLVELPGFSRGINVGDVPVLLLWAAGMAGCGYLATRRD